MYVIVNIEIGFCSLAIRFWPSPGSQILKRDRFPAALGGYCCFERDRKSSRSGVRSPSGSRSGRKAIQMPLHLPQKTKIVLVSGNWKRDFFSPSLLRENKGPGEVAGRGRRKSPMGKARTVAGGGGHLGDSQTPELQSLLSRFSTIQNLVAFPWLLPWRATAPSPQVS